LAQRVYLKLVLRRYKLARYSCFICPREDYSDKSLNDLCPICSKPYDFPLKEYPEEINGYKIIKPLARGFYSSAYIAEYGFLKTECVLKIAPFEIYKFFKKDFKAECVKHKEVARDTEYVVGIKDLIADPISLDFGKSSIMCQVAVLDYIDGNPLEEYFEGKLQLNALSSAQIAIDLFRIREELENKRVNHNDLHGGNILIKSLKDDSRRAGELDPTLRAIAIDLGSVSDESKSIKDKRLGDIHWIADHLKVMTEKLLIDPDKTSDSDFRLAGVFQGIIQNLLPNIENQRTPNSEDIINQIKEGVFFTSSPWKNPLKISSFGDSYNAQTLAPWFVPKLLVDPDDAWLKSVSSHGHLIITGMRGCGKTMLLKAMQFHARAAVRRLEENAEETIKRLKEDNFVGLYMAAQEIKGTLSKDKKSKDTNTIDIQIARLYIGYAKGAVDALSHLKEISRDQVSNLAHSKISKAVSDYIPLDENFKARLKSVITLSDLRYVLLEIEIELNRNGIPLDFTIESAQAFPHLARIILECSSLWGESYILFLLDDVSTRYLMKENVEPILSHLLFHDQNCAFKISSEIQTIELAFDVPGKLEQPGEDRDYKVFDLGAEVYRKIKSKKNGGKYFVGDILKKRAEIWPAHPKDKLSGGEGPISPSELLGDTSLANIANTIVSSSSTSSERKRVYYGITALSRVCVGDIGDVISLYESFLRNYKNESPISKQIQSESYQEFSAKRLFGLKHFRQEGFLKDYSDSFAEASYELMYQSYQDIIKKRVERKRLRQYLSLYVRITSGDKEKQYRKLRELIDAGLFVFAGGTSGPRAKVRDTDPIRQFKLTYRKIYGLVKYIGLAESDRFELSGEELELWLNMKSSEEGKEILLRNLVKEETSDEDDLDDSEEEIEIQSIVVSEKKSDALNTIRQRTLFDELEKPAEENKSQIYFSEENQEFLKLKLPLIETIEPKQDNFKPIDQLILGLGFESRTLESLKVILEIAKPKEVLAIKYKHEGKSKEMLDLLDKEKIDYRVIDYSNNWDKELDSSVQRRMVDITGLAKPVIFGTIRESLISKRQVWICHTKAEQHYPLDAHLEKLLDAGKSDDHFKILEEMENILTGEEQPYSLINLLPSEADESRRKVLCAFSSPKHKRLFGLISSKEYDRFEIGTPISKTPRGKLAKIAANVAAGEFTSAEISEIDSNDINEAIKFLFRCYKEWYMDRGFNFELGLTGSKIQAVACSVLSASLKVAQCYYVEPKDFNPIKFTAGVGPTSFYKITLPN